VLSSKHLLQAVWSLVRQPWISPSINARKRISPEVDYLKLKQIATQEAIMIDFSPEAQALSENLATELVGSLLSFIPQREEAEALGEGIGDSVATAFEQSTLPGIYSRKALPQEPTREASEEEPPFFSPERYSEFLQGIERNYAYDPGVALVDDITINPRRIARVAFPQESFLGLKENSIDALARGIERTAAPRIEKRIKNLVVLGGIVGFVGGCGFALAFRKLYRG
jgi:hypothetical protein